MHAAHPAHVAVTPCDPSFTSCMHACMQRIVHKFAVALRFRNISLLLATHACKQRILDVDYAMPAHIKLSDDGKDLLGKILVSDPIKRITVKGLFLHPW